MASTRSPSPAGDDAVTSGSPVLSPRSKLQKELAALDESSDEEITGPIDTKALFKKLDEAKLQYAQKPVVQPATTNMSQEDKEEIDDEAEDEEDEEEEIIRPRGRVAARMLAGTTQKTASPTKSPSKTTQSKQSTSRPHSEDEDDDEVSAVPRRRRVARPQRSPTPEDASTTNRPVSPGLFKKTRDATTTAGSDSEDDLPTDITKSSRFQALVARKRQERLQKEAEEQKKRDERAKRIAEQTPTGAEDTEEDDVSDITDDEGGHKLTQQSSSARRPARKASKKAVEEMNRETQRMARSMQLAHEAKTKKKITKNSLFERFNFRPAGVVEKPAPQTVLPSSSRPTTPVSGAQTDAEAGETAGTPPSSPPSAMKRVLGAPATLATSTEGFSAEPLAEASNGELPSLDEVVAETKTLDKGKAVATAADLAPSPKKKAAPPKRQFRVKFPQAPIQANKVAIDSDSEPEIQILNPKQSKIDAIFARLPAKKTQDSRSLHDIQQLAQIHSSPPPNARRGRPVKAGMNAVELQAQLYARARAQAKLEKERRLETLKAKGIVVQTEEERERQREQVEDIVARARQEAEEIMDREREDAKQARKERRENGEGDDALGWDDSDDDSYEGSDLGEPVEEGEIEFSGSEDEETAKPGNPFFDEDAAEDEEGGSEPEDAVTPKANGARKQVSDDEDDSEGSPSKPRARRARKNVRVLSDDEEEGEKPMEAKTPKPKTKTFTSPSGHPSSSPKIPTSVLRSATKTFIPGLPVPLAGPAGLGLTQIFAGTMDDSQAGGLGTSSPEFMPSTANFPDSQFSATAEQQPSQGQDLVLDSQDDTQNRETQGVQLHFSQTQAHGFDSLLQFDATQASDALQPTQDNGFAEASPLKSRFVEVPAGTVDTVVLNGTPTKPRQAAVEQMESPLVIRKKGKLRRRGDAAAPEDASLPAAEASGSPLVNMSLPETASDPKASTKDEEAASAFKLMAKAARRKQRLQAKFDAKKSEARGMVEEQADESEDEYAGLGGADGEDESDEEAEMELRKQMIDDAEGNDLNEHKLAALFNERELQEGAAQVDKLFHDITTGMLRKRRRHGGDNGAFDLSDSDDGGEARKRMKRRQFQKMQKALFADERIGKIAENPRNAAFLKSIEDRGSDDELDFGPDAIDEQDEDDSQSQGQGQREEPQEDRIPDSQPTTSDGGVALQAQQGSNANLGRKRNRLDPDHTARLPPALRKAQGTNTRVPASITDVRRSLSSLLDDGDVIIPATDPLEGEGSDDEAAAAGSTSSEKENHRASRAVVDRISLKRAGSSGLSTSRQAFAAPTNSAGSGTFKVPALLRKATTNNSLISQSSNMSNTGVTTAGGVGSSMLGGSAGSGAGGAGGEDGKLKKNAGKRSGINFFARENERREKVRESEMRREKKKWKGVGDRSKVVGGLFGGGSFE
ncbi:MRC1-like domain-containing protein [Apiospora kogelbergensis]|uniref:MRC1-like domain-containing protein n=1 Tax=Apiospora kogelbergensis TaxID=1337665 RepID=A0AAW0QNR6_9PEZI